MRMRSREREKERLRCVICEPSRKMMNVVVIYIYMYVSFSLYCRDNIRGIGALTNNQGSQKKSMFVHAFQRAFENKFTYTIF